MSARPCIFGEVLFDHFPNGRRVLGGAPFNVAWHLQAFNAKPHFISRIGNDAEGEMIRTAMREWGMDTSGLQVDARLPSGQVQVAFNGREPCYDIVHPAAWDAIEAPSGLPETDLLYHGSLALRDPRSRRAWRGLLDRGPDRVFVDVNLRDPWWRVEQVLDDLREADWVKLSRDELHALIPAGGSTLSRAETLLNQCELSGVIMTHGEHGAQVFTAAGEHFDSPPIPDTAVVDTVGAGDALASVMVLGLLHDWPLDVCLARGIFFASAIVGQRGATVSDPEFYAPCASEWLTE